MIQNFKIYNKLNENKSNINNLIDYTYLKDNASVDDIKKICQDAVANKFYAICVKPEFVSTAKAFIDDEDVKICTVVSFPKGDDNTNKKVKETMKAITDGADEIDMVMDYKKLKELATADSEEYQDIYDDIVEDIKYVVRACHPEGVTVKVIIEVEELTYQEIKIACDMITDSGADFIQTSTGYSKKNPSIDEKLEQVKYIRKVLPEFMKIKVSGGMRDMNNINLFLPYADRIGTSKIITSDGE